MLGIVSAPDARLNAGSFGLSLARLWAKASRHVLFIDVDLAGAPLAERFGVAERAEYKPESRGLPSLITAREPLTLKLMAEHCYSLDTDKGSLWALFGPSHPEGRRFAARWLAERISELSEIGRQRTIVVASSLRSGDNAQIPLLRALSALAFLAPMASREDAQALRALCDTAGLLDTGQNGAPQQRALIIDSESSSVGDNEAMGITKLYLEGRLPAIVDERLLRFQRGRKERAFFSEFDRVSERLLELSSLDDVHAPSGSARVSAPAVDATSGESGRLNDTSVIANNGRGEAADGGVLNPLVGDAEV